MSEEDFYAAPEDEQIRRLGGLAKVALARWSLEGAELKIWPPWRVDR